MNFVEKFIEEIEKIVPPEGVQLNVPAMPEDFNSLRKELNIATLPKDFEDLYNELYKLNAFTLKYTAKSEVSDRGGESIQYTINKTAYLVSDQDNNYVKPGDKPAFKKAITLILAFTDKSN